MNATSRMTLTVQALTAALLGVLAVQIMHEACHGVAAVLIGAKWQAFNLFAVQWEWLGAANVTGALVIEASPALLNIVTGLIAALLFGQMWARRRPMLRLFLMYFAGYAVFMGFGYLFVDPLLYEPGGEHLGDWKKVVDMLGGSWGVRIPILVVGAVGVVWGFFWLARAAWRFMTDVTDRAERVRVALPLLLLPYLVLNVVFTILSLWHPLGSDGIFIVAFQYWFGYVGFFWAFFLSAYWLDVKAPVQDASPLPPAVGLRWTAIALAALIVAAGVLVPTVWFG